MLNIASLSPLHVNSVAAVNSLDLAKTHLTMTATATAQLALTQTPTAYNVRLLIGDPIANNVLPVNMAHVTKVSLALACAYASLVGPALIVTSPLLPPATLPTLLPYFGAPTRVCHL